MAQTGSARWERAAGRASRAAWGRRGNAGGTYGRERAAGTSRELRQSPELRYSPASPSLGVLSSASHAHCHRGACAVPRRGAGCVPTARAIMPGVFAGYRGCSVNGRRACHSRYLAPRRSKSRRRIRDKTLQVFPCTVPPSCRQHPTPLLPADLSLGSTGRRW